MNLIDKHIDYLEGILKPLLPYYDAMGQFGDWESGQGTSISWFEMFARSTYGIIAYTSAVGDNELIHKFNEVIHKAIRDERYCKWGHCDQKAVELIPLITLMLVHKKLTWDTYSVVQQKNLLNFFGGINKIGIGGDNWQFFRIVVTRCINALGGKEDEQNIIDSWKIVDECYCGGGWYRDGKNGAKDFYVAFGYHFYSLLYRYLFPNDERCELIKERALLFAKDYQYMFDTEGRMIAYGRSMIYRHASLSFWSMLLCNHILDEEETSRAIQIIDRGLDWWKQQRLMRENGLLNLGFVYRNEYICEDYNSAGSPYWVLKAFAFMLDNERLKGLRMRETEQVVHKCIKKIANEDAIIVTNQKWNTLFINSYKGVGYVPNNASKYMRFAYNSATGFNLSRHVSVNLPLSDDNSLVFDIAGIRHQREENISYKAHDGYQEFEWQCGEFIKVRSYVVPQQDGYIRVHLIKSKIETDCWETGFAINFGSEQYGAVVPLYGQGEVLDIDNPVNSNIYFPHTHMQCIKYHVCKGTNLIADYTYIGEDPADAQRLIDSINFKIAGRSVLFPGGKILVSALAILSIKVNNIKNYLLGRYNYAVLSIVNTYNQSKWIKMSYRRIKKLLR